MLRGVLEEAGIFGLIAVQKFTDENNELEVMGDEVSVTTEQVKKFEVTDRYGATSWAIFSV